MTREQAVIEIRNSDVKVVIGYLNDNDGKVDIICSKTVSFDDDIKGVDFSNKETIFEAISKIMHLKISNNLNININEATLVLPSFGLNVYSSTKTTNTVDPSSTICNMDIDNVISIIKKEKLPNSNDELVEILPIRFYIDGGRTYELPPINEVSNSVQLNANVYTLPKKLVSNYGECLSFNKIKCNKKVIAPVGVSYYLEKSGLKIPTYLLVDFGTRITTCSLIGSNKVYSSSYFEFGINSLIDDIADNFKISESDAKVLLNSYGLDLRVTKYNPPIVETYIEGINVEITKEQLNTLIISFIRRWIEALKNCINTLTNNSNTNLNLMIYGESYQFKGFKEFISKNIPYSIKFIDLNVVGCEDSSYLNCIAGLFYSSFYKGSSNDMNVNKRVNKIERVGEYSEIKDEL